MPSIASDSEASSEAVGSNEMTFYFPTLGGVPSLKRYVGWRRMRSIDVRNRRTLTPALKETGSFAASPNVPI